MRGQLRAHAPGSLPLRRLVERESIHSDSRNPTEIEFACFASLNMFEHVWKMLCSRHRWKLGDHKHQRFKALAATQKQELICAFDDIWTAMEPRCFTVQREVLLMASRL